MLWVYDDEKKALLDTGKFRPRNYAELMAAADASWPTRSASRAPLTRLLHFAYEP